jgi:hypothetical protein
MRVKVKGIIVDQGVVVDRRPHCGANPVER